MKDERQELAGQVREALGTPPQAARARSRANVQGWFQSTAPLITWDWVESPLGRIYVAASARGICSVSFGVSQETFVEHLDPLAHAERDPAALHAATTQLAEYLNGQRNQFDLPVDLERLSPFQASVLTQARRIPAGQVLTYGQVARRLGRPQASRAVGQALGHNPVPIIIPCHRVIAGNGSLGGYSGGGGLNSKKWLLQLEGALK